MCCKISAERQGFEPWIQQSRIADFESAPFDHSGIFPYVCLKTEANIVKNSYHCTFFGKFFPNKPTIDLPSNSSFMIKKPGKAL